MLTIISFFLIALLVAADRYIKHIVVANMELGGEPVGFIDGVLQWRYILNDGASWGMLSGRTGLLLAVTVVLLVILAGYLIFAKKLHWTGRVSFILVIAGGIGNMIDRIFNNGMVVDYIDVTPLFDFPIFNFADCCVTVGGVLLIVYILFFYDKDQKANAS